MRGLFRIVSIGALITVTFMLVFVAGCKNGGGGKSGEGTIEFDVTPVDPSNPMADLAPSKMLVKFKERKSVAEMSAGMGLLTMSIVTDYETKTVTQLVKLLNKKYSSTANEQAIQKEVSDSKIKVIKSNETKMIAGYKCKKATITFEDNSHPPYDVYYTNAIEIENPNWFNEFREIDGVLMEYQIKRYNLELRFTAKKVEKTPVESSVFDTPGDYKSISSKELNDLFVGIQ